MIGVGVEWRVDINQIDGILGQAGQLLQAVAAIDDLDIHGP